MPAYRTAIKPKLCSEVTGVSFSPAQSHILQTWNACKPPTNANWAQSTANTKGKHTWTSGRGGAPPKASATPSHTSSNATWTITHLQGTSFREMKVKRRQMTHWLCVRARLLLNINTLSCECAGNWEEEKHSRTYCWSGLTHPLWGPPPSFGKSKAVTHGCRLKSRLQHLICHFRTCSQLRTWTPTRFRTTAYLEENHPHQSHYASSPPSSAHLITTQPSYSSPPPPRPPCYLWISTFSPQKILQLSFNAALNIVEALSLFSLHLNSVLISSHLQCTCTLMHLRKHLMRVSKQFCNFFSLFVFSLPLYWNVFIVLK